MERAGPHTIVVCGPAPFGARSNGRFNSHNVWISPGYRFAIKSMNMTVHDHKFDGYKYESVLKALGCQCSTLGKD